MNSIVFLEFDKNKIKDSISQAICFANSISSKVFGITDFDDKDYLKDLGSSGLDKIFIVNDVSNVKSLNDLIKDEEINYFVFTSSNQSKYISSSLSIKFDIPIIPNIISVPTLDKGIKLKSSIFTGKADVEIKINSDKSIFILGKNIVDIKSFDKNVDIINISNEDESKVEFEILEKNKIDGDILLTEANVVVSAGRGLKGPENWGMIEELAKKLNAATACSKPVSDAGWRPHHEHVGQTGVKISPSLYFAIGISGAIQHLAGVNSSKTIVVINNDPEAPFFKAADYGVIGDAFEVVPKIIEALK